MIGRNDITSEEVYYERGINLCHGYLTESFVDDAEYIVKVPQNLKHLGVLSEPASVCAKAIEQAFLAQERLQVWNPRRAFVLGSGQIGLLATMMLKLRGMEVYTLATKPGPHRKSEIVEAYGASYVSTRKTSLADLARQVGKPDLIFEATGNAEVCFRAMEVLAFNGALIWTSITGGKHEVTIDAAKINLEWVLGNKLLGIERQRQPPALRAGHPGPVARRADLSGRDRADPHAPRRGPGQLQGHDAAPGREGSAQGFRECRRLIQVPRVFLTRFALASNLGLAR